MTRSEPHTAWRTALRGCRTHDAAGMSGGLEKLLAEWLGDQADRTLNGFRLRELAMLKRLGYSEQELQQYLEEAEAYEMRT